MKFRIFVDVNHGHLVCRPRPCVDMHNCHKVCLEMNLNLLSKASV